MFRTELPLTPHPQQLPPSARVLTIGSCFSDTIGSRLTEFKVATMVNPFGTVFNPISACKLLRAAAGEDMDWQQHLVEARGRWQNHDLHAELGADTPVELLQRIQTMTREAGVFLATADVVVLTLGSAFAYRLRETEEIISNCHKIPAEKFDKELLTADDIIAAVAETHAYLRRINPKLRFILTVSPVRHVKDTLVLNSASKAMLRVACHYLSELLPDVTYFPAYELLMDDLRDYRFYASDMLHPSEVAENYVWERFTRTYFDATFGRFKKEWEGIRQSLNHRPLYPAAPEHREFLEATLERLRKVANQADVRMELLHVERELANLPLPVVPAAPEPEDYDDGEERIDIGSFDEEPAVAATPTATPAAAPKPTPAERKPVSAPEPREDSDDDATDRGKARILRPGFGVLLEDEDEEQYDDNEAPVATSAPAETLVTAESAYDQAYSAAALAESEQDDSEEETEGEGEPERRKKRRSRGGAKRTKRKNARLAAEQTAGELQPESSVVAVLPALPAPLPAADTVSEQSADELAAEVVYVTEEELRRPRRSPEADKAPEPAATGEEAAASEATSISTEASANEEAPASEEGTGNRRSRNNRRGGKREGADRSGNRSARQPLYAAEAQASSATAPEPAAAEVTADSISVSAPTAEPTGVSVPTSQPVPAAETPTTEEAAPAAAKKKPASKRRTSAKTSVAKTAQATSTESAAAETTSAVTPEASVAAQSAPEAPAAETLAPAAKKPARRKPTAKVPAATAAAPETAAAAPTPAQPVSALEPATAAPTKAPARKRAAAKAKPAAASEALAAVVATEPATPEAEAAPAAKTKAVAKPKASAKAKPAAKAKAAAAAPVETPAAETPAAKPAAKAPAKARKATPAAAKSAPAAQPATPEPASKKTATRKPAAKKPAAKKPAAKKATPEPPASENN